MPEITMPKMSDTMEEGKIIRWFKQPGSTVNAGEPIAEIETDKANVEIEAFDSGVLTNILVQEGTTVPVGTTIAELRPLTSDQPSPTPEAERPSEPAPVYTAPAEPTPPPVTPPQPEAITEERVMEKSPETEEPKHIAASPLARRVAAEKGIDIAQVHGTGPEGRIVEADVNEFAEHEKGAAPPQPAPTAQIYYNPAEVTEGVSEETLGKMRKAIGERMTRSKQTIPHFYVTSEVRMEWASRVREELNSDEEQEKVSFNDMIIKACALAIQKFPTINAFLDEDKLILHKEINIGMAVALDDGLVVPVVHDADKKALREIASITKELAKRARNGELHQNDYTGATFTITNLGMFDVESFSAIINPPQSATLAIGTIKEMPAIVDGEFVAAKIMRMTLSADHRVLDGAIGARFLQEVKSRLEFPIKLL